MRCYSVLRQSARAISFSAPSTLPGHPIDFVKVHYTPRIHAIPGDLMISPPLNDGEILPSLAERRWCLMHNLSPLFHSKAPILSYEDPLTSLREGR